MPDKKKKKNKNKLTWATFLDVLKIIKEYVRPYRRILIWLAFFSVAGAGRKGGWGERNPRPGRA